MRDPEFEVSSVRESDVIHANKKDVSCIFRVTTSLMDPPGVRHQCLMLADSESEKTKWVVALNELHRDERGQSMMEIVKDMKHLQTCQIS